MQGVANAVETLALNDFSAGTGEKSLMLVGVGGVKKIANHCIEDSIAQEFQSLVVCPMSVIEFDRL